ncbi:hypothetical protein OROHE_016934 [Orobanche hederae]
MVQISRVFGFPTMWSVEEPDRCIKYLDRYVLEGRIIMVEKANGALSIELTNNNPNMRIIHRKVALILGQWVSEIRDDTRRPVYCALIKLLQEKDLCVRLAASRSLYFHIEDANFPEQDFSDILPINWESYFKLVEEV